MQESEWELEKYGQFLHALIMHHDLRDANRLKTFKLLGNPSDFFRLFFLLEIVHSGSGVIQLLHVRIIHSYWAFWELPKAFAHMYDNV